MAIDDCVEEEDEEESLKELVAKAHQYLDEMDKSYDRLQQLKEDLTPRTVYKDPEEVKLK